MLEGYDLESLRTSSSDSTIQVVHTHFKHSVLSLIRRYGTQAIEERSLISYHFDFEEGIPSSLSSWILYCIKNGEFIHKMFGTWNPQGLSAGGIQRKGQNYIQGEIKQASKIHGTTTRIRQTRNPHSSCGMDEARLFAYELNRQGSQRIYHYYSPLAY